MQQATPNSLLGAFGLLIGLTIFVGCGGDSENEQAATSSSVLVRVGDRSVDIEEFERWLASSPGAERRVARPGGARSEVDAFVELVLVESQAKRLGLDRAPTSEAQREQIRARAERQQRELLKRVLVDHLKETATIDEAELRSLYEETIGDRITSQIHLRQILVEDEATAREALRRVTAGESFEAVSREMSIVPELAENGGDLGSMMRNDVPPTLRIPAFSMTESGQVSPAFPIGSKWSVVELVSRDSAVQVPYEQARPELERQLRARAAQARYVSLIEEERASVEVEVDEVLLAKLGPPAPRKGSERRERGPRPVRAPVESETGSGAAGESGRSLAVDH